MALPPGRPLADPLLEPDAGPRDASGEVVRAPLGNSGRTLAAFLLLAVIGVAVWWMRRPSDLTDRLAGTEWIVVEAGGEAHVNADGQVSAFALGRRSMLRTGGPCGVASGSWTFEVTRQRIEVEWPDGPAPEGCADENRSWTAAVPASGRVELHDDEIRIGGENGVRAFRMTDRPAAGADQFSGRWASAGHVVDIGPRGLFQIGDCMGHWNHVADGIRWTFETSPADCSLGPIWGGDTGYAPMVFDDVLYLVRPSSGSAFDPLIVRLERAGERDSPLGSP